MPEPPSSSPPTTNGELTLTPAGACALPLREGAGTYHVNVRAQAPGTLCLTLTSPRPLRVYLDGERVIDQPLHWRSFQRCVRLGLVVGLTADASVLRIDVAPRPRHPAEIDASSPSRNRADVMAALMETVPDVIELAGHVTADTDAPSAALHFPPGQFRRDRLVWQEVVVHPLTDRTDAPRSDIRNLAEQPATPLRLHGDVAPERMHDATSTDEHRVGLRHIYVPVFHIDEPPPPVRDVHTDRRVEPVIEIVGSMNLTLVGSRGSATLPMPVYESLGRHAPQREFTHQHWPDANELLADVPEPILPPQWLGFKALYDAAWRMLLDLVADVPPESGLPGNRIATSHKFGPMQFVWDTSFTAMATAYAARHLPATAGLDLLYSRQFDGGYLHREHDARDGLPVMWEPDFSPNPPLMAVAEWQLYRLTGDAERLRRVFPALR
ncbi:MAG: hypothetical protein AAF743_13560, partial [Planctomycetota bacterium]